MKRHYQTTYNESNDSFAMNDDARMQELEDFLANRMPAGDSIHFREQTLSNPSLAFEVDLFRDMVEGISRQGRSEIKAQLQRLEATLRAAEAAAVPSPAPAQSWPMVRLGEMAAVFLIGICAYAWVSKTPPNEKLFARFYEPYPNVVASLERGAAAQGEKAAALQLYENSQYKEASVRLRNMLRGNVPDADLLFYAGLTSIQLQEYAQAQAYLQQALRLPAHALTQQATWYLSLVHVKRGQTDQAFPLLKGLAGGNGFYGEKARALLAAL
jgi:tetratricopeptide (TPR) repeat protein